jgi:transcriptional regulator with XRE-family HTH domain
MEEHKQKRKNPNFNPADTAYLRGLGRQISELRSQQGCTQASFASKVGLSPNTMNLIEAGRSATTVLTLRRIAAALNVTAGALAHIEPDV